jgi:hypothetical protein
VVYPFCVTQPNLLFVAVLLFHSQQPSSFAMASPQTSETAFAEVQAKLYACENDKKALEKSVEDLQNCCHELQQEVRQKTLSIEALRATVETLEGLFQESSLKCERLEFKLSSLTYDPAPLYEIEANIDLPRKKKVKTGSRGGGGNTTKLTKKGKKASSSHSSNKSKKSKSGGPASRKKEKGKGKAASSPKRKGKKRRRPKASSSPTDKAAPSAESGDRNDENSAPVLVEKEEEDKQSINETVEAAGEISARVTPPTEAQATLEGQETSPDEGASEADNATDAAPVVQIDTTTNGDTIQESENVKTDAMQDEQASMDSTAQEEGADIDSAQDETTTELATNNTEEEIDESIDEDEDDEDFDEDFDDEDSVSSVDSDTSWASASSETSTDSSTDPAGDSYEDEVRLRRYRLVAAASEFEEDNVESDDGGENEEGDPSPVRARNDSPPLESSAMQIDSAMDEAAIVQRLSDGPLRLAFLNILVQRDQTNLLNLQLQRKINQQERQMEDLTDQLNFTSFVSLRKTIPIEDPNLPGRRSPDRAPSPVFTEKDVPQPIHPNSRRRSPFKTSSSSSGSKSLKWLMKGQKVSQLSGKAPAPGSLSPPAPHQQSSRLPSFSRSLRFRPWGSRGYSKHAESPPPEERSAPWTERDGSLSPPPPILPRLGGGPDNADADADNQSYASHPPIDMIRTVVPPRNAHLLRSRADALMTPQAPPAVRRVEF